MKITFAIQKTIHWAHHKKIDKYIEIVASNSPRLNSMSKDSQLSIFAALNKRYAKVAISMVDNMADLDKLVAKKPDLVVLGIKFVYIDKPKSHAAGSRIRTLGYLKANNINFMGSEPIARAIGLDKQKAKQKVMEAGLQSSRYYVSSVNAPILMPDDLQFPLFVKPSRMGGSQGIDENSVVYSTVELKSKVKSLHHDFNSDALIEEYLPGREFSVAVTKQSGTNELSAMPIEIIAPADKKGNSFLSKKVKKADLEEVLPVKDLELKKAVNALAINVFKALGARDYGRIDIRLNAHGTPNFIEANLMPGLSNHGYLSRCFLLNKHFAYEEMIASIVELAFKRVATGMLAEASSPTILESVLDETLAAPIADTGLIV